MSSTGRIQRAAARVAQAVERALAAQRPDGSWPYGEGRALAWSDSFHSGYVLTCLDRLGALDPRVEEAVARGAEHYRRFFDATGRAQLWANRRFPEDGHSAGTALTTLAVLLRRGLVDRELLERVATRVLEAGLARRSRGAPSLPLGTTAGCATCAGVTPTWRWGCRRRRSAAAAARISRRGRCRRAPGLSAQPVFGDAAQRRMHAVVLASLVRRLRDRTRRAVSQGERGLHEQLRGQVLVLASECREVSRRLDRDPLL